MTTAARAVVSYLVAVLCVALVTAIRMALDPILGDELPFTLFFLAVIAASWYGGFGPALVALLLGFLAASYFFISPRHSFAIVGIANHVSAGIYLLVGLASAFLSENMYRAQRRAETNACQLTEALRLLQRETRARQQSEIARVELSAIVESSEDAIIGENLSGRILSWNRGAERLYGYRAGEVRGESVELLLPPDRPNEIPGFVARLKKGEHIEPYETVRRRKDGSLVEVSITVSPIKNADGVIIGVSAIARDITRRRQIEEELRQANQAKDEFLAMLAHELRNPLAPLANGLQILRLSGNEPEIRQQVILMMRRQFDHFKRLIDDLLDVSRITRGKIKLRKERLDLARLARTAAEDFRHRLDEAGIALNLELPPTPVWIQGDNTRLAQVITNLLDNAVKFTDRGGSITVSMTNGRPLAELTVRDTGIGIESSLLPHLFDIFTQGDRSLDRGRGGLGLGLSLVKGLTELHEGTARAASEGPGRGAALTIALPSVAEPPALDRASLSDSWSNQDRLRILVVEDNEDSAESLRLLLALQGHDVRVAHSGPEAVQAATTDPPDVVLCDIGLPGLDGYGVARALRRHSATAQTRLIAVTGYGSEHDHREAQAAGFDSHLTKPVAPEDLRRVLVTKESAIRSE